MEKQIFVARERELGQLDDFLNRALTGQGALCFVTGEAGSGKTALVTEFARRAQEQHGDLVVAVGQSDAQTGVGDAYLPFREMLGQLTGDVETKLAQGAISQENAGRLRKLLVFSGQALAEVGPELVGIFVPGAGLVARVGAFVAEQVGWLDKLERLARKPREDEVPGHSGIEQAHIFEQYTNVLIRLAEKRPLLLLLDDLQWADAASIGLLFRLGRRIGGSRIVIAGTYRPEEVALGRGGERHPLEKVLAEFKRYHGNIWVDLDQAKEAEGRYFVDSYLDTEPNRLGEGFRQALYEHTDGHPLFTVELLRDMQERGDLVQDEHERWVEGPVLDWHDLPDRVEGVIEERIGRLEGELQEALAVGSVEGEDFTAEVVAQVQAAPARGLIRRLSGEVEKQHRLVNARGVRRLDPSGQRLSLYRFQHNLFQAYLYGGLDEVERVCLHEDVGHVLEGLYGERADEVAVQLARHFGEAGVVEKAREYLRRAGEQAAARYANDEAVDYFSRALGLAPEDDTPEWAAERYDLLLAREKVYDLQGEREAQARDLAALEALAEALDEDRRRAEVALRRAHYAQVTCDYSAAATAAQRAILLAQSTQDASNEAAGYLRYGQALLRQGDYDAAWSQLEQALSLAPATGARQTEAGSLLNLGTIRLFQGNLVEAGRYFDQSLRVFQETDARRGQIRALNCLAIISGEHRDFVQAEACYKKALQIAREIGDRLAQSMLLNNLGVNYEEQGDYAAAETHYKQTLGIRQKVGNQEGLALTLMNLGRVSANQGGYSKGRGYYQQCLDLFREIDDKQGESEGLSFLSLLCHQVGDDEAAYEHSRQALQAAQEIGDRNTQAYPLTFLGHALVGLDRLAEAADAYQQAMALRREFGQPHKVMEPLAGLARISLAQDDLAQAMPQVEEILSFLEDNTLEGTQEPFRVYLTCYRVLRASEDPRAQQVLANAYHLLQERASKISDEGTRRSFLENVAVHREIVSEFARGEKPMTMVE